MRFSFAVILAALALVHAALPQTEAPPVTGAAVERVDLREFAEARSGRIAFAMYLRDQKVGWVVQERAIVSPRGRPVHRLTETVEMYELVGGDVVTTRVSSVTDFALLWPGNIEWAEESVTEQGRTTRITVTRSGDRMAVTRRSPGVDGTLRQVPVPKENLAEQVRLSRWLSAPRQRGDEFATWETDWERDDVDQRRSYEYLGPELFDLGGDEQTVHRITLTVDGAPLRARLESSGLVISMGLGLGMEVRREDEATAKDRATIARVDTLLAIAVPVDKSLGDPTNLAVLTLEVSGAGCDRFPTSSQQRVTVTAPDAVRLEVRNGPIEPHSAPLSAADRERYLASTQQLPAADPKMNALATQIAGADDGALRKASRLQQWVYDNLAYSKVHNADNALDVLANESGDCSEFAQLFVALARAAGIPARPVTGLVYSAGDGPKFWGHAWAEVHDGASWVAVDPTWNQVYVDAGHIKLSEGERDLSWVGALDVSMRVLDFETYEDRREPPLQLVLEVAGEAREIELGELVRVPVDAGELALRVEAGPQRRLRAGSLVLDYPREFAFYFWEEDAVRSWMIEGEECTLTIERHAVHEAVGLLARRFEELATTETATGATIERGDVTIEFAGSERTGRRLTSVDEGFTVRHDLFAVPTVRDVCVLHITTNLLESHEAPPSAQRAIDRILASLRLRR